MSANAGAVKATIEGDSSSFTKAASSAADSVEHFAKRAKRMATDFAVVGAGITASVIGIVSKVQSLSPAAHAGFEAFTNASQTLGIQIATIALPALKQLGDILRQIANWLAGLSPATKAHIADWIVLAAQVGAAALVFGRMMELLKGLGLVFQAVTAVISAIGGGPLLLLVAGIAVLATAVALVHKAWRENWNGIRDTVSDAIGGMIPALTSFASMVKNFVGNVLDGVVTTIARLAAMAGALVGSLQAGADVSTTLSNVKEAYNAKPQDLKYGGEGGAAKLAGDVVSTTKDVAKTVMNEWSLMAKQMSGAFGNFLKDHGLDFTSKPGTVAPAPLPPELKAMLAAGAAEQRQNTLADSQRAIDMAKRQREFGQIGQSQISVSNQKTDGFKDFDDALKQEAAAMRQQEQLLSAAKMMDLKASQLAAAGDFEGSQAALDSAANLKGLAQQAGVTSDAAEEAAKAFVQLKEAPSQFAEGLKVGAEIMTRNLGQLGQVINDVAKGWQQGGIWGALLALIMDLLSMVDGWKDIQAIANGQLKQALKQMSSGLGAVITGLKPLMGAIGMIASAVNSVLNPILKLIGNILGNLAPIFASIGITMQLMGPILDVICRILGAVLSPIFQALGPILTVVAESFLATELAIQYVILGFDMLVDWVDKLTGGNNQQAINDDQASINATQQQMQDLWNKGLGGLADSSANAAEQLGKAADAANSVAQAFQNVPEGFRTMFAEYAAQSPVNNGGGGGAGVASSSARKQFLRTGVGVRATDFAKKKS